jgi:Uma2 family endonuclease
MADVRIVLRYRDYAALPDDGRRYEIHDGELSVMPAPSPRHQETLLNLATALRAHIAARRLGKVYVAPVDVILSDTSIVQPDIVYVATEQLTLISGRGIEGAPTLVVEILSPSTGGTDRHTKMRLYARYGIPWYWLVDSEVRTAEIYGLQARIYELRRRFGGDEPLCAEPFPDLTITSEALWA